MRLVNPRLLFKAAYCRRHLSLTTIVSQNAHALLSDNSTNPVPNDSTVNSKNLYTKGRHVAWMPEEIEKLKSALIAYDPNKTTNPKHAWKEISKQIPGRTAMSCSNMARKMHRAFRGEWEALRLKTLQTRRWAEHDLNLLVNMCKCYAQPDYQEISRILQKFTPEECRERYNKYRINHAARRRTANNRRRSAALDNGDKVQKAKGEPECIKRAKWGPEDDEKLTNLIKGGTLDDTVLVKTFPQFPMSRIQQAIRSLTRKRNNRDTTWTKEQDEELLRRIKEHGFRWTLVSKMYLISKTPLRCRERYLQLTNVNTISFSRWTKEETEKLIDVVIAHLQEQQIKKEQSHLNKLVNTLALRKYEAVLSAKNKAILDVINEDKPNGTAIDVVRSNLIKGVDWSWVASRMGKRTSSQCEYRFWYKFAKQYKERSYYRGPWSREEDRLVYELQREKDMPIRVVLSKLPNKRTRESVICRYATYILPIVGILKQCRGPDWDPLADGFKEVHERCEIWAWYYRKLEGYRVNDQFECPHDMDLTGYYKWCKEMPEDADIQ